MQNTKNKATKDHTFEERLTDALSSANELYSKTNFRDLYFEGLRNSQLFEVLLDTLYKNLVNKGSRYYESLGLKYQPRNDRDLNINDYLNQLKVFFPEADYKEEYVKLDEARKARNSFIHGSFKDKRGNFFAINLDREKIHSDSKANTYLDRWSTAFRSAYPIIIKWMLKSSKK